MKTVYRIGVSGEVAQTAAATRRRNVNTAQGPVLLVFGKVPVFLSFLPPEVERDPHLIVTPMSEEVMRQLGGKLTLLDAPGALDEEVPAEDDHIPDDQVIGAEPELLAPAEPASTPEDLLVVEAVEEEPKPKKRPRR